MNQNNIVKSAALLKSMGHPIRLRIIITLSNNLQMTVTELSNYLCVDQPIMSLHLAVLRKHKIIKVEKEGKQSKYSILEKSMQQIALISYYSGC